MRPLRLEFSAFGSYPDTHVVDFGVLQELGIFVVTGPTGTGKSTIFDAMTFALYGQLAGDRRKLDVRSHHVPDTTRCYVVFEFEAEGVRHRVTRAPKYLRPAKRGSGLAPEDPENLLEVFDGRWESIATKSEVSTRIAEIVGLTAEQFEQVVLLPQGKFEEFLRSETKHRRELLKALFGRSVFARATDEFRRRAKAVDDAISADRIAIGTSIDAARSDLVKLATELSGFDGAEVEWTIDDESDREEIADRLASTEPRRKSLATETAAASTAAAAASKAVVAAENCKRRDDARRRRVELLEEQSTIEGDRESVRLSTTHRPLLVAETSLEQQRGRVAELQVILEEKAGILSDVLTALGLDSDVERSAASILAELNDARSAHDSIVSKFELLDGATSDLSLATKELEAAAAASGGADARIAELTKALEDLEIDLGDSRALAGELSDRERVRDTVRTTAGHRRNLDAVDANLVAANRNVESAETEYRSIWDRFVAGNAPRLARDLVPGESCPVCGSTDHPAKAAAIAGEIVDYTDVETAKESVERVEETRRRIAEERSGLVALLGADASTSIEEFEDRLERAEDDVVSASKAAKRVEAADLLAAALSAEVAELVEGTADRVTRLATARTTHDEREAEVRKLNALVEGVDREELGRRSEAFEGGAKAIRPFDEAASALKTAKAILETRVVERDSLQTELGIDDLSRLREIVLDPADESTKAERVEKFDSDLASLDGAIESFDSMELPETSPDLDVARGEAIAAEQRSTELNRLRGSIATLAESVRGTLALVEERAEKVAKSFAEYEVLNGVATMCEGGGKTKISLETWVLAGELDRVLAAANVHLLRMTGSRYRLERTDDAGHGGKQAGLDIAVRDSFTGATRPPRTLSGGEKFQASLALALGLADVVSQGGTGSGHRFEALFLDEGFGSLDGETLSRAMTALSDIHEGGRMVGVITHVEAMKEQLPLGIRVEALPNGRGSTLTVRPED